MLKNFYDLCSYTSEANLSPSSSGTSTFLQTSSDDSWGQHCLPFLHTYSWESMWEMNLSTMRAWLCLPGLSSHSQSQDKHLLPRRCSVFNELPDQPRSCLPSAINRDSCSKSKLHSWCWAHCGSKCTFFSLMLRFTCHTDFFFFLKQTQLPDKKTVQLAEFLLS